ncbi:Yip1 domain protein [Methanosarcina sp. MTP4]|uniref:YIP1 family protein n=1 Tax=Methanosarcina sp. MTP4 TaxID=1434100 RepID=UPI0006155517|nr:YIP1 family protein [Methanosarcina sp. MTP4]AKB25150.1 Yip1 domain protein [Methanosarcina sp. MTP4]
MDNLNLNNLIFDPNSFFREKIGTEVSFKYPLLIMLVISIFAIGSSFLVMNKLKEFLPSDMDSSISATVMSIGVIGGIVGGLIGTFLNWFILAGILYSISYVFASKGSFKRTLEFVGYGFVPQIFSSFISLVVTYVLVSSVDFSAQDPQLMAQGMEQMFSNNPLFYTSQIIGILCLLLSAYIWIFALLHARNMSFKNAALTVCIPAGLSIVSQIYTFLFTTGSL